MFHTHVSSPPFRSILLFLLNCGVPYSCSTKVRPRFWDKNQCYSPNSELLRASGFPSRLTRPSLWCTLPTIDNIITHTNHQKHTATQLGGMNRIVLAPKVEDMPSPSGIGSTASAVFAQGSQYSSILTRPVLREGTLAFSRRLMPAFPGMSQ